MSAKFRARHSDFIGIPRKVADSAAFRSLPAIARALYVDLRRQHNGHNNGQIAAVDRGNEASPGLAYYGWSHSSVHKNLKLLLEHGLIEKTRQGGIGVMSKSCTLYAFTDLAVAAHTGKGIKGAQPSLAYIQYVPRERERRVRKKVEGPRRRPLVHAVHFHKYTR
jgi:DNA-binding transcriptional ArsR family regulator